MEDQNEFQESQENNEELNSEQTNSEDNSPPKSEGDNDLGFDSIFDNIEAPQELTSEPETEDAPPSLDEIEKEKEVHSNLGWVYYKQGMFDEALTEYQEVINLDPNDTKAIKIICQVYKEKGEVEKAIQSYTYLLSL
ncbi:tetratricopeptide repeat protein, partial [Candidatus Dependentiae bacterium]|nr:tetratricopeptide repeat protein [Candidatus Dependentiae bacterium]